ncbi:hypothetical protein [Natronosalvus caseinilyticus]|uniref:hypothetical protein n=1 Tax=Natronosalvus caseinilyticus TaxID=2953747 RepID=UPI0028A63502|nr:hypothetical protein [Natronosalvus caseinilyticus]
MDSTDRPLLMATLVYIGSVLLVGLPSTVVLYMLLSDLLVALDYDHLVTGGGSGLLLVGVSLLLGLQLAVEVAAIRLGGLEALGRGSRRVAMARFLLLTLGVFAVLAGATWIGFSTAIAGFGWAAAILGLLVGFAGVVVLYRGASAFLAGFRGSDD